MTFCSAFRYTFTLYFFCTIDRNVLMAIVYVRVFVILENYIFYHCKTFLCYSVAAFPTVSSIVVLCHILMSRCLAFSVDLS